MATLNVNKVLRNPRFRSSVVILRSTSEIDDYGRTQTTETSETISAVVQPAGERDLERLPEGDRIAGTLKIYTETMLNVRNETRLPDEVEWRGVRHVVKSCDAWLYGPGFYVALATPQDAQAVSGE